MKESKLIQNTLRVIMPVSHIWLTRAQSRLNNLTKLPGSLGQLETLARRYCAIRKTLKPQASNRSVFIFAADHGITEQGISAYPREVTAQMVMNFIAGGAAINVLTRNNNTKVHVVDIGVDADFGYMPGLIHCKIRRGFIQYVERSSDDV